MNLVELIGFMAAVMTTIAFVPQVIKTFKTRSADDLSLGMFIIFTLGVVLWLIYGIIILKYPIIVANAFTLVLSCTLLYYKMTFKKK